MLELAVFSAACISMELSVVTVYLYSLPQYAACGFFCSFILSNLQAHAVRCVGFKLGA